MIQLFCFISYIVLKRLGYRQSDVEEVLKKQMLADESQVSFSDDNDVIECIALMSGIRLHRIP